MNEQRMTDVPLYNFDLIVDNSVLESIEGKKIVFYDLNPASEIAFLYFLSLNIYVEGFVLDDSRRDIKELRYFNKPMFFFDELSPEDFVIIDISGKSVEYLKQKTRCPVHKLLKNEKPIILCSNSKEYVRYSTELFDGLGLNIIRTVTMEDLRENRTDADIVVNIDSSIDPLGRSNLSMTEELTNLGITAYAFDPSQFLYRLHFQKDGFNLVITLISILYILHKIKDSRKDVYLFGDTKKIRACAKKFELIGINLAGCISANQANSGEKDLISKYDLIYKNPDEYLVAVLPDDIESALEFIEESGLNFRNFVRLDTVECVCPVYLDPNLGYNLKESYIVIPSQQDESDRSIHIGIIGGSTSDLTSYAEKTWCEYLLDIANEQNIKLTLYNGALRGYTISQELMKFVRDMSHLKLDILLSYSGTNDGMLPLSIYDNPSISAYQKTIFERLVNAKQVASSGRSNLRSIIPEANSNQVSWGRGIVDRADNWIHKERLIQGMCRELRIKFYAILQPDIKFKQTLSAHEKEIIEHFALTTDGWYAVHTRILSEISQKMNHEKPDWFVNFLHALDSADDVYFDRCHLLNKGNRIIAEKIFELIKNDMLKIMQEKRRG